MKYLHFILILSINLGFLSGCDNNAAAPKELSEKKDQNMFGHYIPRGLTIKKEELIPGYVMFWVPNSASTYLINRDGVVVHEWKGIYGSMAASTYLGEDGSLIQTVNDPDFPVFAGGGESGRLQKLSWDGTILWDFEYSNEEYHSHHDLAICPMEIF